MEERSVFVFESTHMDGCFVRKLYHRPLLSLLRHFFIRALDLQSIIN